MIKRVFQTLYIELYMMKSAFVLDMLLHETWCDVEHCLVKSVAVSFSDIFLNGIWCDEDCLFQTCCSIKQWCDEECDCFRYVTWNNHVMKTDCFRHVTLNSGVMKSVIVSDMLH